MRCKDSNDYTTIPCYLGTCTTIVSKIWTKSKHDRLLDYEIVSYRLLFVCLEQSMDQFAT
jgi:hypothetical protein